MKTKAFHLVVLVLALFSVGLLLAVLGANAAATAASHNSGWIDHFDNPALDPRWTWVNEDPAFWSLTAHPGFLRITTQEGAIRTNSGRNVLVAWPNLDDMQIETKVTFTPTENVLNASLIVY